jgi:predicted dehydrogenase
VGKSVLVIGHGSIGKRHARILSELPEVQEVHVMTRQAKTPFPTLNNLSDVADLDPDYVVIASETSRHFDELRSLENLLCSKTILVEKPLFDTNCDLTINNNEVYVGYNLRFLPALQMIREKVRGREIWEVSAICGSYLPDWRPERDYRKTSSAQISTGGGVINDLSHELDYVSWLCGAIKIEYCSRKKLSNLEIETDDFFILIGHSRENVRVHVGLNYFSRRPRRKLYIDGVGISIDMDFISNTAIINEDGNEKIYNFPNNEGDSTYIAQHRAMLSGHAGPACTFIEGLELMSLIEDAQKSGIK